MLTHIEKILFIGYPGKVQLAKINQKNTLWQEYTKVIFVDRFFPVSLFLMI